MEKKGIFDGIINAFKKLIDVIKTNSFRNIFLSVIVLLIFFFMIFIMINHNSVYKSVKKGIIELEKEKEVEHDKALKRRADIYEDVCFIMRETLYELNADRVLIIELHNGTNNPSGLPFLYGEATYETDKRNVQPIQEELMSISLSKYSFPMYLLRNEYWIGNIADFSKIDNRFAQRLLLDDNQYIAIAQINGVKSQIGYYIVSYTNEEDAYEKEVIQKEVAIAVQKLAILLGK